MQSTLLLLLAAALPSLSLAQTISNSRGDSPAVAQIKSAFRAGKAAVTSVAGLQATDPAASAVSAFIATAIPSHEFAIQNKGPGVDTFLVTQVPESLRSYESSAIAAQTSAFDAKVSPVVSELKSLWSGDLASLSSVWATQGTPDISSSTVAVSSLAAASTASVTSSSSSAEGTGLRGTRVGVVAGMVAGGLGIAAAL